MQQFGIPLKLRRSTILNSSFDVRAGLAFWAVIFGAISIVHAQDELTHAPQTLLVPPTKGSSSGSDNAGQTKNTRSC